MIKKIKYVIIVMLIIANVMGSSSVNAAEISKDSKDSDVVSGLIAYTSHNENEIYTLDYSNRFTAQVLYRLDYKWPVTDDRYLESAIEALDRLAFFD